MKKFLKIPIEDIQTDASLFCPGHILKEEVTIEKQTCFEIGCEQCLIDFLAKYTVEEED